MADTLIIPTTTTETIPEALDHLATLTADQIAKTFYEQGFTGLPCVSDRCPVAKYLMFRTGNLDIAVGSSQVMREDLRDDCLVPESVAVFIQEFDMNSYPLLIEDSE